MTDPERRAVLLLYRKHPRALPETPRGTLALFSNVVRDPVRQPPLVRRALLERSREIRQSLPPLP